MARFRSKTHGSDAYRRMFETRSHAWREAGLEGEIDRRERKKARGQLVVLGLLIAGVLVAFSQRAESFPVYGAPVRIATVVALVLLGWGFARALGTGIGPSLFSRMDPGTAGTVGFVIRLATIAIVTVVALRIAGV